MDWGVFWTAMGSVAGLVVAVLTAYLAWGEWSGRRNQRHDQVFESDTRRAPRSATGSGAGRSEPRRGPAGGETKAVAADSTSAVEDTAQAASQATRAMILGFGSLICFGFVLGPLAMWLGRRSEARLRASSGDFGGRLRAAIGFWVGLVGTVLWALPLIYLAIAVVYNAHGGCC
jgi:hypothetical protein